MKDARANARCVFEVEEVTHSVEHFEALPQVGVARRAFGSFALSSTRGVS